MSFVKFLVIVPFVYATVYWNPGDEIHRHNVEFNHTYHVVKKFDPPINLTRVTCPPRLEDEIAFVNNRYAKPNPSERLDIFRVESSWLRQMEDSLYDLTPRYGSLMAQFDQRAVQALTVNGKLLAIPSFLDFSLIYYRKDLLDLYNKTYPTSWDEFEETATFIQTEQRKLSGNSDFWGFMWQGSANEILTVLTMQFVASHGGGTFIEDDGTISINNPNAIAAFQRAKRWLNVITPSTIVNQHLHETKLPFLLEKAAFLMDLNHVIGEIHNWSPTGANLFSCGTRSFSSSVGLGHPPGQPAHNNISVPWFWGWSVNKYTPELNETLRVLDYLASEAQQLFKAERSEDPPTRIRLQENDTLTCGNRSNPTCCDIDVESQPLLRRALEKIGPKYFDISKIIFTTMHEYLVGNIATASEVVEDMECTLHRTYSSDIPSHCRGTQEYHYRPSYLNDLGIALCVVNMALSLGFGMWVAYHRNDKVIKASQPHFLYLVCVGCMISSVSLIFIGVDDKNHTAEELDGMCQATAWFYALGFATTITSLYAKTYRVKLLMVDATDGKKKRREGLKIEIFFYAIGLAVLAEIIYMTVWTLVAPIKWVRECKRENPDYGYCEESVGNCGGTIGTIVFLAALLAIHLVYLSYILYICYLVRNVPTEFSEHKYITASAVSSIEILVVSPPIIALSWQSSAIVSTIILTFALFATDFGVLVMIFVPKIFAAYEKHDEKTLTQEDILFNLRRKARKIAESGTMTRSRRKDIQKAIAAHESKGSKNIGGNSNKEMSHDSKNSKTGSLRCGERGVGMERLRSRERGAGVECTPRPGENSEMDRKSSTSPNSPGSRRKVKGRAPDNTKCGIESQV